ncbi:MAG TPA: histidinol-phosphatase [Rhizomicrobium sp.]|jgi:myo-inositol-1(or 4)-monophosphatase|nr:histidinol-phosphatase [Rhizomicrobium sp.]
MTVDDKLIQFANRLADASGAAIRPFFRQRIDVAHKEGRHAFDPVTEADRGGERAIRAIIERERPDDAILGEEYGERPGASGWRWILDPVDGTRAFITGRHEWGSLIALEKDGEPVLGILDQPVLGERFLGVNGRSVLIQDDVRTPLKVRACDDISMAILCATDPSSYMTEAQQAAFARVKARARLTRYHGDCYIFAMLAMGFIDVIVEGAFRLWDVAAIIPLVEGAGGIVSDWKGAPWRDGEPLLAAGDPRLHGQTVSLLAQAAAS